MLRAVLERVILFFVPILLGYLWRVATEARSGERRRAPPASASDPTARRIPAPGGGAGAPAAMPVRTFLWLAAAGATLVALSLVAGPLLPHPPDRAVYVPAMVGPGGDIAPGHFATSRNAAQ